MPTPALDSPTPLSLLRCCLLALGLLATGAAQADEYTDVNRLIGAKQFAQALASADKYLAAKPRDPQMRFLKGVIQGETAKPAEAMETFLKITEDYPELPEPHNNLAVLYAGQGQFDKARASLEMAIRLNPGYAVAHENLGDVQARLASQSYSRALQLSPANAALPPKIALLGQLLAPVAKPATPAAAPAKAP
jgi:tetratricopeptide (TPR) repeat protein